MDTTATYTNIVKTESSNSQKQYNTISIPDIINFQRMIKQRQEDRILIPFDAARLWDNYFYQNLINPQIYQTLKDDYFMQKNRFPDYLSEFEQIADIAFDFITYFLLTFKPEKIRFYITDTPSIFYRIRFINGIDLRYEIFINSVLRNSAFSIYQVKELIAQDYGDINEMNNEISEILKEKMLINTNISTL